VRYDIDEEKQFVVVHPTKQVVFQQSAAGLYYHDTTHLAMVIVNTLSNNQEGYTNRAFIAAKQVRQALGMVGYPSKKDFKNMVSSSMIRNCPVTPGDISAANKIFGSNITSLKGKKVRITHYPILTEYVEMPREIVDLNKEVTIAADVMFVDGLRCMITTSINIKFMTME
jgi:hypothetical protein